MKYPQRSNVLTRFESLIFNPLEGIRAERSLRHIFRTLRKRQKPEYFGIDLEPSHKREQKKKAKARRKKARHLRKVIELDILLDRLELQAQRKRERARKRYQRLSSKNSSSSTIL